MNGDFLSVKDLANALRIEPNAVKQRLFRLKIKPVSSEALYEASVLKLLREVPGKGRPKKKPDK